MDLPATSQQKKIVAISEIRVTNMVVSSKEGHHVPYREGCPDWGGSNKRKKTLTKIPRGFLLSASEDELFSIENIRLNETLGSEIRRNHSESSG